MKKILLAFSLLTMGTLLVAQTVTPSASTYQFGDDIVISFTGSTAPLDWVGIYNEGETPDPNNGGVASITWFYINGTQDNSNTTVISNGTLTFTNDLPDGNYIVHLLCCDGYTVMASNSFTVEGGGPAPSELYQDNFPFVGGTVTFNYAEGPGNSTDWIGIYKKGESPDPNNGGVASIMFQYTTGTEGELTFDLNVPEIPAGEYDAHFFCCDAYDILASTSFRVYEPTQPGISPGSLLMEDIPITFDFSGGTGFLSDWVGIYPAGEVPDGDPASISFLYVPGPDGQVTFDATTDLTPGTMYDAHLFCCDGYDIIASYENWTVAVFNSTNEVKDNPILFNASTPGQGNVWLTFNEPVQGEVCLFNTMGQNMQSRNVDGQASMNMTNLQPGFYAVLFQGKQGVQTAKVVVK